MTDDYSHKFELISQMRANTNMGDHKQRDRFFNALEQLEMLPEEAFDENTFGVICDVFTDNPNQLGELGALVSLLDVKYFQAKSPTYYFSMLNNNIDRFFPNASGWLATILCTGLWQTTLTKLINSTIQITNPMQARVILERLNEIFEDEVIPIEVHLFLDKLAQTKTQV